MGEKQDRRVIDVPRMRKVLDWASEQWQRHLRGELSEWNQETWFNPDPLWPELDLTEEQFKRIAEQGCGSSCCVAGKLALDEGWVQLSHGDGYYSVGMPGGTRYDRDWTKGQNNDLRSAFEIGRDALGLDDDQARVLFDGSNEIQDLWALAHVFTDGEIEIPVEAIGELGSPIGRDFIEKLLSEKVGG